ncbi:4'-phosphopantetheinyl transferase superfamily protein [Nodosilinea sp. FACHB-131]|uniref:4'-phosphopantetheinyl transferase family protein n=1 Tax=Cyanophyceae TaxID=3028117 RepID=UPI0016871C5C|nr:4'-phosphopantetheinyl transferase superfamily protein [Nodosilinea sp. FACHB-131]MBD1872536.1 4'-phosphopantetheinyl transferase superfamily protein [Nodosilinea sp. FACHB-131]
MSEFRQGCTSPAIDLWLLSTDFETTTQQVLKACLSPAEQAQLQRIRRPAVQGKFLASRGCLRHLLSRYTGQAPAALTFVYGPKGKPELSPATSSAGAMPKFNLSHSGQRLLVAISTAADVRAIGVDIEALRPVTCLPGLCRRYLTAAEAETVLALPHPQADHHFLRYWTGKEACLKSLGIGIADSMQALELRLEVPLTSGPTSVKVATAPGLDHPGQLYQWYQPGYMGAIAVQAALLEPERLRFWQTTPAALLADCSPTGPQLSR